jgi:hypothetical protein
MTKKEKARLKELLSKAVQEKHNIAEARDRLRDTYYELSEIVDSADRGLEDLNSALESLSEYL